jgi:hypothetical protein
MKRRVYSNALRSRARTSVVITFSLLPIEALLAQSEDADALQDLRACAAVESGDARLACYDGVLRRPASALEAAPSAPDTTFSAPASAPPSTAASAPPPPPPASDDGGRTIVVTEVRLRSPTSAVFVTASGQVWEQSDNGRGRYPEAPFEATLERGSLNSMFLISPAGGPRIRVRLRE